MSLPDVNLDRGAIWSLLVPVVLGFLGVYLLLPQGRRSRKIPGAVAGAAALALGATMLVRCEFLPVEGLLFYVFAGIAVLAGGLMITQSNPVRAALSFALVVLSTCGLFLLLGAPFLMAATIIIYAGAIIVTFLFVIMLAQQEGLSPADQRSREPFFASLAGFVLMLALLGVLQRNYRTDELDRLLEQVNQVSQATNLEQFTKVLGDPQKRPPGKMTLDLADRLEKYFVDTRLKRLARAEAQDAGTTEQLLQEYVALPSRLESAWLEGDAKGMAQTAARIHELGLRLRAEVGSLAPRPSLPLSSNSGTPASAAVPLDASGRVQERLPAANVAAVGRALFTDHLVAVEIAGMLLLVATIGAIVIAGRRGEELR